MLALYFIWPLAVLFETELLQNEKDIAEHVRLIDLSRNNISRVCEQDSIEVTEKMLIERYSQAMHIGSNVEGIIRADKDALDVFCATFPASSNSVSNAKSSALSCQRLRVPATGRTVTLLPSTRERISGEAPMISKGL